MPQVVVVVGVSAGTAGGYGAAGFLGAVVCAAAVCVWVLVVLWVLWVLWVMLLVDSSATGWCYCSHVGADVGTVSTGTVCTGAGRWSYVCVTAATGVGDGHCG